LRANFTPINGLKFSVLYAPKYYDSYNKTFNKSYKTIIDWDTKTTRDINNPNGFSQSDGRSFTNNVNALASYSRSFGSHYVSALAGYESIKYNYEYFSAGRQYYTLQDYEVLNAGAEAYDSNSGSATQNGLVSYFGRLNYSYKDRYLFEANLRRDASSRFAQGNRVGIFPSISVGWRMSEEKFIKSLNFFSNLKFRGSWGELGNQQIGSDFPYTSAVTLGSSNYIFGGAVSTGAAQKVLANQSISWETTKTANVGLDASILKQKLSMSFDLYSRNTKDLLLNLPIPSVIGYSAPMQNAGDLENKGYDLSLNWQDKLGDFSYGAKFIISNVKNKVTNLAGVGPIINGSSITQVGSPIGLIYGYETVGIFQDQSSIDAAPKQIGTLIPGNLQYKDQNGDGKIDSKDRVVLGNPFPTLNYGIDLYAEYKNFDFSISLQGVGKRDVLLGGDLVLPLYNAGKIQEWHVTDSWNPNNRTAKFPILAATSFGSNDNQTSSTWVFNASYLRARNLSLGYTLPKNVLKRVLINNLRIYFSGQNLLTLKKLPVGIDPLVTNGADAGIYPVTASYTFGIDVKF
jgi:TonB-linked SusC/RagA family outer membrane protein